jgi:hypothetical protein
MFFLSPAYLDFSAESKENPGTGTLLLPGMQKPWSVPKARVISA